MSNLGVQGKTTSQMERELVERTRQKYFALGSGKKGEVAQLCGISRTAVKKHIDGGFKRINRKVVRVVDKLYKDQEEEIKNLLK